MKRISYSQYSQWDVCPYKWKLNYVDKLGTWTDSIHTLFGTSMHEVLQTSEEVKLSLTGLWFRMNDKIQRLKNLLMSGRDNAVEGETVEDAYLDVSNYGIMATIVGRDKWGK